MTQYAIHTVRPGEGVRGRRCVATTDRDGIGLTLATLAEEGEFDGCQVGILRLDEGKSTGTWLINPFGANRRTER